MRRNLAKLLLEFEIVEKLFPLLVGDFGFRADELAGALENLPQPLAQLDPLAEILRQNMTDAQERIAGGEHLAIGIDEIASPGIEIGRGRIGGQNFVSQRLQLVAGGPTWPAIASWA